MNPNQPCLSLMLSTQLGSNVSLMTGHLCPDCTDRRENGRGNCD